MFIQNLLCFYLKRNCAKKGSNHTQNNNIPGKWGIFSTKQKVICGISFHNATLQVNLFCVVKK